MTGRNTETELWEGVYWVHDWWTRERASRCRWFSRHNATWDKVCYLSLLCRNFIVHI